MDHGNTTSSATAESSAASGGPTQRLGQPQPFGRLQGRALRLLCPACGKAPIFRGWFAMHDTCPACGRQFHRDAGYLLGSIYFNYGVTGMLVVILYFSMFFADILTDPQRLVLLTVFGLVFPMWFFRYARALWIAFDEQWDPWPNDEEARQLNRQKPTPP